MQFIRINKKRIQEIFILLSFSVLALTSLAPQLWTSRANAAYFSYPKAAIDSPPPVPEPDGTPLKSSSQDVTYPLIKESGSDFYYEADLGSFQVWFYDKAKQQAITRIGADEEHFLEFFVPKQEKVPIELTKKGYSYHISQNLRLDYALKSGELKEDIIIPKAPKSNDFKFGYKKEGLIIKEIQGEYYFYRKDNLGQLFKFQKPTVKDAENKSGEISLEITKKKMVFHLDQDFLKSARYPITIDPVAFGNSTSAASTGPVNDRHIVRTSRGIVVAVWYQNSTNYLVGSRTFDDGETWIQLTNTTSGNTVIGGDANSDGSYSVFADEDGNIDVAYAAATCDNSGSDLSACHRVLSFNATTFNFSVGSEVLVFAGTSTRPIDNPSVVESSNGTIYVAIDAEGSSGADDAVATRSSTDNGASFGWAFYGTTNKNDADDPQLIIEPGTNELFYTYVYTSNDTLYHMYYNSSNAWESEVAGPAIGSGHAYSLATAGGLDTDIHLVYTNSGVYYTRYNGTSWGNNATLDSSGNATDAVVNITGNEGYAVAAVTEGTVERIQYKKRDKAGTWDTNWNYISEAQDSFEAVQTYDNSASSYTNETTDAKDYGEADIPFLVDPTNDYLYIGRDATFTSATFFLSTNASSTVTPDWEYYSSTSGWTNLSVTDNTSGFTASGQDVNWGNPADWATTSVNGVSKYWVRVTGTVSPATTPVASYILPQQSADNPTMVQVLSPGGTPGKVFEQTNVNGFGDSDNDHIYDFEVFDNYLYAGTGKPLAAGSGAELWRSDNGIAWSQVSTDGFGDSTTISMYALQTAGEYLYVGVGDSNGGAVWRSTNGTGFTKVTSDGFGNANNTIVQDLEIFNNYLYASTYNTTNGTAIWRCDITNCDAQVDWSQVNSDGFGNSNNIGTPLLKAVNLNGTKYLYAGTHNATNGGNLWRCSEASGCDAAGDWSSVSSNGLGNANNIILRSGEVFNDYLYIGTKNTADGTFVYRCDTTVAGACDANGDFNQINSNGFGDSNNENVRALKSYYGQYLYAGTRNTTTGAEIWRCSLGSGCDASGDWSQINDDGFGKATNTTVNSFGFFRNYLYMGVTDTTNGPAVFRTFFDRASVAWTAGSASPYDVKYDELRYRPNQENWRWYDDQTSADPSTDFAAENTAASGIGKENAIRLRITLRDDGHIAGTDIRMKLQYSTDDSQFFDVAGSGETYAPWRYFDGGGTDDSTIGSRKLTDSDTSGPYVEELSRVSTFDQGLNDWTEWDFSLENYNATANDTYYFRAVWSESREEVYKSTAVEAKNHPSLSTATSYILSLDSPAGINFSDYTLGGSGSSVYTFNSSEKITMRDDTGSGAGWTVTATSTDLTEDHSWSSTAPWGANSSSVRSLAVYNNYLYAGTYNNIEGAEIWRTNDGSAWNAVVDNAIDGDSSGSDENGFGDSNNIEIRTMFVFNSYLYAATRNETTGIEIWRSNNPNGGDTWTQINSDGFGDANNYWSDSFAVLSGNAPGVYIGTEKNTPGTNGGAELWKCTSASNCDASGDWSQVNTDGFGDNDNEAIDSLQEFGSNLYVGIDRTNSSAAELWRCDTSANLCSQNSHFTLVDDTGFGDSYNTAVTSLADFNGYLYAFTENSNAGTEAWRCTTASGCDAVGDFAQTNNNGFGSSYRTNTLAAHVWKSDYDYLYVGITDTTGAEVLWSEDGNNWNSAGVGGGTSERSTLDLMDFGNEIFAGMSKDGGVPGVGANLKKSADADIIIASDIDWSTGTITALLAASLTEVNAGAGGAMDPDTSVTVATANSTGCSPDPPGCGAGGYTIQPTLTVSDLNNESSGNYSATLTLTIQ